MKFSLSPLAGSLMAVTVLAAHAAFAQAVRTWAGGSGDFSVGANWSGGAVPGALDDALFNTSGAFAVSVTDNVETLRLQFNAAGLDAGLNIAEGNVYTVGTNFTVKGGTAASPTRMTVGSGTIQLANAFQSIAPGVGSGFTELVITNASLLAPSAGYFMVAATANSSALIIGPGGYYYGPQILTADQAQNYSNRIVVAGKNARLVCNGNAQIRSGLRGWGNATIVTNNGYLSCGFFYAGANTESRSNTVVVASGGVLELPASSSGTFAVGGNGFRNRGLIDAGGLLLIGASGACLFVGGNSGGTRNSFGYENELVVQNGGIVTNNGMTCLGGSPTNNMNSLVITNGGYFYAGQHLYIGELGRSNSVYVADNARLDVGKDLFVGNGNSRTNAWNNSLTVGAGGIAAVAWTAYVGGNGCSNELTVADGGVLTSTIGLTLGAYSSATGNLFRVNGGTVYTDGNLTVGDFGSYNRTVITGGKVSCGTFYVGKGAGTVGNELVLEGGTLLAKTTPFVGYNGVGNAMTVRDSGVYSTTNCRFVVGQSGSVNARLNILTGGYVRVKGFLVGDGTVPTNAVAYICGENARLDSYGTESGDDLRVGAGNANGSRLYVCDGGVVDAGVKALGVNYSGTATNGQMFVRNGTVCVTNDRFFVQVNGVLNVSGSNSLITCRNFELKNSAAVEFEIPRLGMQTNAALIQVSNNVTLSGTPALKITCSEWVQRTGGKITLLEYTSTLAGDLTALVAAAALDDPHATLSVVGKRVVLSAPGKTGTLIAVF